MTTVIFSFMLSSAAIREHCMQGETMNMTILVALIIAIAAIFVLKRVVVQSIVRKAGRAAPGTIR